MQKAVCAGLLSIFVATPASAKNEDGWYLGGGFGSASSSGSGMASSSSISGSGGFGYKFNKNFALGYESAVFDVDNKSLKFIYGGMVATGFIPLNEKFSLLGKFGYGVSMDIASSAVLAATPNFTSMHFGAAFGAGVEYNINDNWKLRGTYDSYDVDVSGWFASSSKLVPVSNMTASVYYQF